MGVIITVGFMNSILCFSGVLFGIVHHEWKRSSPQASQQSLQNIYHSEGLWSRCTIPVAGVMHCDNYGTTLFDVSASLQALRAIMILSALLLLCSCICDVLALDCVTSVSPGSKIWLGRVGGLLSVLAGGLCVAAVSWYAVEVMQEFRYDYTNDGIKYTFGAVLYVGWIAGGLAIIIGALVLFLAHVSVADDEVDYSYRPPKTRHTEEYI